MIPGKIRSADDLRSILYFSDSRLFAEACQSSEIHTKERLFETAVMEGPDPFLDIIYLLSAGSLPDPDGKKHYLKCFKAGVSAAAIARAVGSQSKTTSHSLAASQFQGSWPQPGLWQYAYFRFVSFSISRLNSLFQILRNLKRIPAAVVSARLSGKAMKPDRPAVRTGRVALIIHRYSETDIAGGLEKLAESYKKALQSGGYDTDVITTTAKDYLTWEHHYAAGITETGRSRTIRFLSEPRSLSRFRKVTEKIDRLGGPQNASDAEWSEFLNSQGPVCPDLLRFYQKNLNQYDAVFVFSYLYWHTSQIASLNAAPIPVFLIPAAHDEWAFRFRQFRQLPHSFTATLCSTPEDKELILKTCPGLKPEQVPIVPFYYEKPVSGRPERNARESDTLLYIGRVDSAKGVDELIRFFISMLKEEDLAGMKLVLAGSIHMPVWKHPGIEYTGFISEEEKQARLQSALALVNPSKNESLSIVALEAWAAGIPVIANSDCAVLKGQCERSKAGITYSSQKEFNGAIRRIRTNPQYAKITGPAFIQKNYSLEKSQSMLTELIRKYSKV